MHMRCVGKFHRWTEPRLMPALLLGILLAAAPSSAQSPPPLPTVGAGVQTSYVHTSPEGGDSTDAFPLNSVRLYVSGTAAPKIKFMFNTEYDSSNHVGVLDAVAQFELSPAFNIWAGRFLPPSDRANLYGPYYAHEWAVYTDGIQDGYPFVFQGRDNGVALLGPVRQGQSLGRRVRRRVRDRQPARHRRGRVQIDFWDAGGRLLPERHLLRRQEPAGHRRRQSGSGRRQLGLDRRFPARKETAGRRRVLDRESSIPTTTGWAGTTPATPRARARMGLRAISFRKRSACGKFEILGKYAKADFTQGITALDADYNQKTTEVNFNYVIKQFNARVMTFYQGHEIQRGEAQRLAGGSRPPDPDVSASSPSVFPIVLSNEGVNL